MTSSLTLASQTIGFISFSITLLTLLGVYRDLISTLRSAPIQIPLILGNLRQEILAERTYLRQRCREGRDPFNIFPGRLAGLPGSTRGRVGKVGRKGGVGSESSYVHLLEVTVKDLWLEFRMLERPFLVQGAFRAEAIAKGDYWGEEDVDVEMGEVESGDEKGSGMRRRRRRRSGATGGSSRRRPRSDREDWEAAESDLRREGAKYYNTNLAHRFIWWQTKSDIKRLSEQIQRIQIRRMERDIFETDELVRVLIRGAGLGDIGVAGRPGGRGPGGASHSDSDSDDDDGGRASAVVRSRPGSRAPSRSRSRRGSTNYREVEEHEVVRRAAPSRPSPSPPRPRARAQPDHEANVAARRTERRRSGPHVEYEVLRRGSDGEYVVVSDTRERPARRQSVYEEDDVQEVRRRSYSRDRGRDSRQRRDEQRR